MAWFNSYSRRSRGFFFDNVFKSFSLGGTTVAEETTNDDATTEVKTTNNLSNEVMANITSLGTLGNVTVTNKITGGNIEISGNDIKNVQSGQNLVLSADGGNVVINDNFTVNNNAVITGNLTVNGTTTTVNSTNTTIADPLYILNNGQTGTPTKDSGFVIERGSSNNVAWIWDESADQFVAVETSEDGTTAGDISIIGYADMRVKDITANGLTVTGNITGSYLLGNGSQLTGLPETYTNSNVTTLLSSFGSNTISTTGNITGGAILSSTVQSSSGNLTLSAPSGSHVKVSNVSPIVLDYVSDTHILYSNAGELEGSAGLTYNGTELYTDNISSGGYLDVTGNTTVTNFEVAASSTVEFNQNILGNIADPVSAQDAATKTYVDGQLSAFNGDTFNQVAVSGATTITASGATTLNLAAGAGTSITTDNSTKTVTIAIQESIFDGLDNQDIGLLTESSTQDEDLGLITDSVTKSYELGSIVALTGVAAPTQLILPEYETASRPDATVQGQLIYNSTTNAVQFSNGTEWDGYAGTASPTFTGTVTAANITASGTITGNVFVGDGSQLTGISSYTDSDTSNYLATHTGNISAGNVSASTSSTVGNVQTSGDDISSTYYGAGLRITDKVYYTYNNDWVFNIQGDIVTPVGKSSTTFRSTGSNQSFTVPAGVNYVYVKCWGAGGAGGNSGGWSHGSPGGGGGHARGLIPVTPGQVLSVVCGIPGQTNWSGGTATSYGGGRGFANNSDNRYAGQGGGLAGIWSSTYANSQANALIIAGGGGGGGCSRMSHGNWGGAGGGTTGQQGNSPYENRYDYGGTGGSQASGGSATNSTAGGAINGGYCNSNAYGGGGGGGWYGGGGGGYVESHTMAGGGGGSGYLHSSIIMGEMFVGNWKIPAMSHDEDLPHRHSSEYAAWCGQFGYGGDAVISGSQYTAAGGGSSWIKIYY